MSDEIILVVDDSRQTADFVAKSILPSLGYQGLTAYGGRAGLDVLRKKHQSISLMLIDLQMPDISGLEVLQAASAEGINVPAIMVTAHSSEQVITDAFRLGIHDYLKKPVDVDKLNVAITRALAETRLRSEKAALTIQLQEQVTRLTALSDVGRSVISTLNIGTVLSRILEAGVSLTHAEHGFIALRDANTNQLYLRAMIDFGDKQVERVQVPVNDRLLTQAIKNGKPIRISRPSESQAMKVSTGLLVHSLINVPIFYQKQPLGVLSVNNHTQRRNFTKGDETLLTSLADYAAIAIGNASSYEKAKQEIEERKRAEAALQNANSEIAQLIASLSSILIVVSPKIQVVHWNPSAHKTFDIPKEDAIGIRLDDLGISWRFNPIAKGIDQIRKDGLPKYLDPIPFKRLDGSDGYLGLNISPIYESDVQLSGFIILGNDITERKALENQLSQSQKLKSIGQLAAGIAHEINTPIQYVNDNTSFIKRSMGDLLNVLEGFDQLLETVRLGKSTSESVTKLDNIIEQIELDYLRQEIPSAIDQSLDGIMRVTEIVRAMKEFSHPGVDKKVALNVNNAIQNTLTVARNEWKYVADIRVELEPNLPKITCLPGEINQAFLNIIVNAAQAIQEMTQEGQEEKGVITIKTLADGDWVEVQIKDTGPGIPEHARAHIFEPFYTTKEVGKGSGQGLAIAYNIIEIKHGGKLTFETQVGRGTTFRIRLPITDPEPKRNQVPGIVEVV